MWVTAAGATLHVATEEKRALRASGTQREVMNGENVYILNTAELPEACM